MSTKRTIFSMIEEDLLEGVKNKLETGKFDVNTLDEDGYSPLILASSLGLHKMAEMLIANKADLNYVAKDGASPLFCAAQVGRWNVVESLVKNAADVNARLKNGPTPLYIAAQEGYDVLVTKMIECKGYPDCRAHGITPLFIACQERHVSVVRALLKGKADPNKRNKNGGLPLAVATWKGHVPVVRVLLEESVKAKVKVNKFSMGVTPLMSAAKNNNLDLAKILINAKSDMELTSQTNNKVTAALFAAEANNAEILQLLKDNGADLTKVNMKGFTPADIMIAKHDVVFDGPRGSSAVSKPDPAPQVNTVERQQPEPQSKPNALRDVHAKRGPTSGSDHAFEQETEEPERRKKPSRHRKRKHHHKHKKKHRHPAGNARQQIETNIDTKIEDKVEPNIEDKVQEIFAEEKTEEEADVDKLIAANAARSIDVKELFDEHDADGNGYLYQPEFMAALAALGVQAMFTGQSFKAKVKECFARFDTNFDGRVSFTEFVKFYNWFLKEAQRETSRRSHKQWGKSLAQQTASKQAPLYPQIKPQRSNATLECFTLQKDPVLGFGIYFEQASFDQQQARDCQFRVRPGQQYLVVKETRDAAGRVGPASLQGILPGDVLLRVERQPARDLDRYANICKGRRHLVLEMLRMPMPTTESLAQLGHTLYDTATRGDSKKQMLPGIGRRFIA